MKKIGRVLAVAVLALAATACDDDVAPCSAPFSDCNGSCINTSSNSSHCGGCDKACDPGLICAKGACTISCPAKQSKCGGGDAGALFCANLQADNKNCGACGTACEAGKVCSSGK